MPTQNTIAKTIDTTDQESQYDASVKRLLSQKIILAWILRCCVKEFSSFPIPKVIECIEGDPQVSVIAVDPDESDMTEEMSEQQIEGLNTEDTSIKEGKVYYDIRFSAVVPDTNEPVQLIINIEAQKSDSTPYPLIKRAVYYASRMISAQKNRVFTHSHYEEIRKVYSIWIQMNVNENKANTITEYSLYEKNVVGSVKEKERDYDLLTIIMLGLGKADEAREEPILRLLDILLSSEARPEEKKAILEEDFDIPMSVVLDEETNIMCNLGAGIREKAFEQATKRKAIMDITTLMDTLNVDIEKAMDLLRVDMTDRDDFRKAIKKNPA